MYIAIQTEKNITPFLSPVVMKWQEGLIIDMNPCLSYWRRIAGKRKLGDVIKQEIANSFSHETIAVVAKHPWHAILVLNDMKEKELKGFINLMTPMGERLLKEVSWSSWWKSCEQLSVAKKNQNQFKKSCLKMKLAMQKTAIVSPYMAQQTFSHVSIRRRYGQSLCDVFSFGETDGAVFPWDSYKFENDLVVKRVLDYPLLAWQQIKKFLQKDLHNLVMLHHYSDNVKVVSLEWRLLFDDCSTLRLPIQFRYPHSLHLESPHFYTALLQASYFFEQQVIDRDDLCGIVEWNLSISQKICATLYMPNLFSDSQEEALCALENQLAVPLYRYDLGHAWSVEESFKVRDINLSEQEIVGKPSVLAQGRSRPLFILKNKTPLLCDKKSSLWQFLERSMNPWWKAGPLVYDYYRHVDKRGQNLWVYRDEDKHWYVKGIFG